MVERFKESAVGATNLLYGAAAVQLCILCRSKLAGPWWFRPRHCTGVAHRTLHDGTAAGGDIGAAGDAVIVDVDAHGVASVVVPLLSLLLLLLLLRPWSWLLLLLLLLLLCCACGC